MNLVFAALEKSINVVVGLYSKINNDVIKIDIKPIKKNKIFLFFITNSILLFFDFKELRFSKSLIKPLFLPIFKNFVENALFKEDFDDFKIPENIYLTSLNYDTGTKSTQGEKNSIIEALKLRDINNIDNNNLISTNGRDKIIKFRQFY